MMKNEKGSTLAEVMAAFVILLMASQLLLSGSAAARKMERRADEISNMADTLKEQLAEDSKCISGKLCLKIDENTGDIYTFYDFEKVEALENELNNLNITYKKRVKAFEDGYYFIFLEK